MAESKICGLGSFDDLLVARHAGARWGGFVFYPPSPRHISFETATAIADQADTWAEAVADRERDGLAIKRVALIVDAEDDIITKICQSLRPHMVQCHGHETPQRVADIKTMTGLAVIKSLSVAAPNDIAKASVYEGVADMVLFDSAPRPNTNHNALPGGRGETFNWQWLAGYNGNLPWLLAGGLTPDNVATAIATSGAKAVDVSSGVETKPGVKSHPLMQQFVAAAKQSQAQTPAKTSKQANAS